MQTNSKKYYFYGRGVLKPALIAIVFFASSTSIAPGKNPSKLENIRYERIDKKEYISLHTFKSIERNIRVNWDPLLLTAQIIHGSHEVKLQVDAGFFISDGQQYPIEYPPVFYRGKIYLPKPLVEELFTELKIPVKYKFDTQKIYVQKDTQTHKPGGLDFIILDPGHGGKDPGAFGVTSVKEKKITLDVALHVFQYLKKAYPGTKIYLTRDRDKFISLEKRAAMANQKLGSHNFGIFISLHCNSTLQSSVKGYEIFYLSQNPGSEEDRKVMIRENDNLSSGESSIAILESYLLNSQILAESKMLARQFNKAFMTDLKGFVISRGVRKADFHVLRKSLMPAVLVELGYISNSSETTVLQTDLFKDKISKSISNGIGNFIRNKPGI